MILAYFGLEVFVFPPPNFDSIPGSVSSLIYSSMSYMSHKIMLTLCMSFSVNDTTYIILGGSLLKLTKIVGTFYLTRIKTISWSINLDLTIFL